MSGRRILLLVSVALLVGSSALVEDCQAKSAIPVVPTGNLAQAAALPTTLALPPLLGQWSQQNQRSSPSIRAKSMIKLGIFVAAIIGGLISFLIRMVTRSGPAHQNTAGGANWDGTSQPPSSSEPLATQVGPPPLAPGSAAPSTALPAKPGARRSSGVGFGVAIGIGLLALLTTAIGCGGFLIVAFIKSTTPAPFASMDQAEAWAEQFDAMEEQANAEFDQRWEAAMRDASDNSSGMETVAEPPAEIKPTYPALEAPEAPLATIPWKASELVDTGISVTRRGMSFQELAPEDAVLVGFRLTADRNRLRSIQPIYQRGGEYLLGERQGNESTHRVAQRLARPGHAVSALRLEVGGRIEGMQVEFGQVVDGRIDSSTSYVSPFVGRKVNQGIVIEGNGDVFVGVAGSLQDGIEGLHLKRNMALGSCNVSLPALPTGSRETLPRAGGNAGTFFTDDAPEGGILVGVRFFIGRLGGAIQAMQPIYQVDNVYHLGKRHGPDGGLAHQVLAKPGYAVGKIDARAGLVLNSAKLTFQRVIDGKLDPADAYESPRHGSPGGGQYWINSNGRPIVGLGGSFHSDVISLEAVVLDK